MDKLQCINTAVSLSSPITFHTDNHVVIKKHLYFLLTSLQGISQSPRYHPEGDALCHSLQVFQLAYHSSSDPQLWAAALLHDIGKISTAGATHANLGAEELEGLLSPRIVWLVRHHLHLLRVPRRTRRWLRNTPQLHELELLRHWDLQGRSPLAKVITPQAAIHLLMQHTPHLLMVPSVPTYYENKDWL